MKYFHLFLFSFFIFSCSSVYQPSSVMVPLLEEKGDLEAQVTFRMGDMTSNLEAFPVSGATINTGLAYAFSNKYAAIFNAEYQNEYFKNNPTFMSEDNGREGYLTELYLGRYFSQPKFSNTGVFLGFGRGFRDVSFSNYDPSNSAVYRYKSNYLKASLLLEHTIREKWRREDERLAVSVFNRFSFIYPYNIKTGDLEYNYLAEYGNVRDIWTIEPGINISVIYGRYTFFVQSTASMALNNLVDVALKNEDVYSNYASRIIVALGAKVNLNYKK